MSTRSPLIPELDSLIVYLDELAFAFEQSAALVRRDTNERRPEVAVPLTVTAVHLRMAAHALREVQNMNGSS
jgi:hypothetical protein